MEGGKGGGDVTCFDCTASTYDSPCRLIYFQLERKTIITDGYNKYLGFLQKNTQRFYSLLTALGTYRSASNYLKDCSNRECLCTICNASKSKSKTPKWQIQIRDRRGAYIVPMQTAQKLACNDDQRSLNSEPMQWSWSRSMLCRLVHSFIRPSIQASVLPSMLWSN